MLILTDVQKCALSIAPVDGAGNPAPVDGVPLWGVTNNGVLDLVVAEGGMSAVITANGPLGTGQVTVSADADLGEGVTTLSGLLDVEVIAGQAVSLGIAAGTPEPK